MDGKAKPTAEELNELITSLFNEYTPYLVDYAQNNGCSPEVAEDLVQDTFVIALEKSEKLYYAPSQRGWIIRTLRNLIGNHQRNIIYAQKLSQMLERRSDDARAEELSLPLLYEGMIDEGDLDLLIRYWVHGDPVKKIAADLGLKFENCKKRLQRARARFAKAYEEQIGRLE